MLLPHRGVAGTATLLRRSADSVQRKALSLLRAPRREGPWTTGEDQRLRQAWGALEPRVLGPLLGRVAADVRRRAEELRRQLRRGPWASEEQRALKKFYGTRRDEDLEVCLLRPREDIRAAAERLCLAKDKRFRAQGAARVDPAAAANGHPSAMPRWTATEVRRLQELYPDHDNLTVARTLGRTVTSVANKAYQLGIKKSPALLADIGRANISRRYSDDGSGGLAAEA